MEVLTPAQPANAMLDIGPVPMSFPAILRHPGIADRFAHLRIPAEKPTAPLSVKRSRREEKEGKRWVRRKENARFVGNAHIVFPSKRDFSLTLPNSRPTFPQPLPNYLSRNNVVPAAIPPAREPGSANAGRFSLSLKGMRRELRKSGPHTELLVREVEGEIVSWLKSGGVLLAPDSASAMSFPGVPIGTSEAIREVSRTPLQLVWTTADDAFTRYVVHCCARYHDVVSFSKDTSDQRLTYLLRPNVTRPNYVASAELDTPPTTDLELSAQDFDSESDLLSDRDYRSDSGADSDVEPLHARSGAPPLAAIAESLPPSPLVVPSSAQDIGDGWSVIGASDADVEADDSASEAELGLSGGVAALSLSEHDPDGTFIAQPGRRQVPLRTHMWTRGRRSASSPSRSPARRVPSRVRPRMEPLGVEQPAVRSFYDYLYS
ncbi:hypothetical protein A0H81_09083 [Grifola frondosa]|uniref:Uncharacterized protein n=1 Tax=Grifola frondosa TaxID=5627 RepID=A0A1C7M1P8_GRIFR|nr:hypothetical protein A0H81_09083 [Grifola frondosa]